MHATIVAERVATCAASWYTGAINRAIQRTMQLVKLIFIGVMLLALATIATRAGDTPSSRPPGKSDTKGTDEDPGVSRSPGPTEIGDIEPEYWRTLTEDQQTEATGILKSFAKKSTDKLKHPLRLSESKLFLFYSDLSDNEAARYVTLLERMYTKLAELFDVDKGPSLWRGKALVVVFTRIEDYRLYERLIEGTDPANSFGMTHCYGDALVHMAFFRYPNDTQFAHLLVHESVHGFLHRYRSPVRVPSWANEGLAEDLASELVPDAPRMRSMNSLVRTCLSQHNNALGDFFTARQIDGWQYPLAETLCAWMIHHDRKGYLDFINGIKDGQKWEESLKSNFKLTRDKMISDYAKAMGLKPLRS